MREGLETSTALAAIRQDVPTFASLQVLQGTDPSAFFDLVCRDHDPLRLECGLGAECISMRRVNCDTGIHRRSAARTDRM